MGRKVIAPPPGEIRKYVPDISIVDGYECGECGTQYRAQGDSCCGKPYQEVVWSNLDDDEPVTVYIKNPTEAEKRRLYYKFVGVKEDIENSEQWKQATLAFVDKVENYTSASGKAILNGEDLYNHGDFQIVEDVAAEVIAALSMTEESRKKQEEPQASPSRETSPSPGTVENAGGSDSMSSANVTVPGMEVQYT